MNFDDYLSKQLENPEFRKAYEHLQLFSTLGNEVLRTRIDMGLTVEELADMADVKRTQLYRLENAESNVSLESVQRIFEALGKKIIITFEEIK